MELSGHVGIESKSKHSAFSRSDDFSTLLKYAYIVYVEVFSPIFILEFKSLNRSLSLPVKIHRRRSVVLE